MVINTLKIRLFPHVFFAMVIMGICLSCSDQLAGGLFKAQYPHQRYDRQLRNAGLEQTPLYRQWYEASLQSLHEPLSVNVPYREQAYVAPDKPSAMGYIFDARHGEQLQVALQLHALDSPQVFIDLFEISTDTTIQPKHLTSADTGTTELSWDIRRDGQYLLRVQPELLANVSFTLLLTAEPSLANPVAAAATQHIGSVFGDSRDGGRRRHEGIDIFAAKLTPVVAAADGTVGRVGDNRLGGKVVWLRPRNRGINLYYAHLDSQLVSMGQVVRAGDTIGLMGNTGNAITTPPHLHFGIYATGGAVDPMPFVRPGKSTPPKITADAGPIGDTLRTTVKTEAGLANMPVFVEAASSNGYRVVLPDNSRAFLPHRQVAVMTKPLRTMTMSQPKELYTSPDTLSARIATLASGDRINIIAEYEEFLLVQRDRKGWITR